VERLGSGTDSTRIQKERGTSRHCRHCTDHTGIPCPADDCANSVALAGATRTREKDILTALDGVQGS
jgi:hypothetical protein